ncbi:methyltransferase domain-containing protein [Halobacteriovorax sp. HLS]|uniref:methyltransferase domain-containing protein n=1 Tax=Halobacteriovorax sp. HLS TaxID=2234000 RepID=UPI000FD89FBC|nr:methyltransferase domain-containing protein [Halobacteriovorax sp. HLS]
MTDSNNCCAPNSAQTKEEVKEYYGKTLQQSSDLKTNACCTGDIYPQYVKDAMKLIHDEVMQKYYGCGLTIPHSLKGKRVLDLGSGAGRDCYLLSYLVGEEGEVIGVDMTDEQLEVANRHIDYHTKKFGYNKPNTRFIKGDIEKLHELDLEDNYFDVIISNCVINLATDKNAVLKEVYRILRPGGEMYFSDVYSDRRIPAELVKDPVLYGECLSGALYWNDFLQMSKNNGFLDPRNVEAEVITIENEQLQKKVGQIKFYSVTYRLFKIDQLEADCEDYGQAVTYKGTISECPEEFRLDEHHVMKKGVSFRVCGNSFLMLQESRFKDHFEFSGDMKEHLGIFEGCGGSMPFDESSSKASCC